MLPTAADLQAEDPIALLLACHARIRKVTAGVRALAELPDPRDPRAAPTAREAARYLRVGLPLHAADEDLSLAPRLRVRGLSAREAAALDRMEDEHEHIEDGVPVVVAALERFVADPDTQPALVGAAAWLEDVLLAHIEAEEDAVFPACVRLEPRDLAGILVELRERRHA